MKNIMEKKINSGDSEILKFQNSENVEEIFAYVKKDPLLKSFSLEKREKVFPKIEETIGNILINFKHLSENIDNAKTKDDFNEFIKNEYKIIISKDNLKTVISDIFISTIKKEFSGKDFPNRVLEFYTMKKEQLLKQLSKFYYNPIGDSIKTTKSKSSKLL